MEKNLEFNFWVYRHDTWMLLTQSFSNDRLLLFTINSSTCSLKPLSGLPITNFPLHSVKDSFLFHGRRSLIAEVTILIEDQDPITLIAINPFDPPVFFHRNDAEAQAIVRIVSQLKKGETPDDNSNPYLRQLHKKDVPNYVTAKGMNWNENISPWEYYYSNMKSVDWKRKLNAAIARIILLIGFLATTLMIIYIFYYFISN